MRVEIQHGSTVQDWRGVKWVEVNFAYPTVTIHKGDGNIYTERIRKGGKVDVIDDREDKETNMKFITSNPPYSNEERRTI